MNPYVALGSGVGTADAALLSRQLTEWHDAMVEHERRLRSGRTIERCDDDCPHVEAPELWTAAVTTFGPRAHELAFLRSRARAARRRPAPAEP